MDKRKLRWILLGVVGVIMLVIGMGAANIYSKLGPAETEALIVFFSNPENYEHRELFEPWLERARREDISWKHEQFTEWLLKWIVRPFGLFAILTAALVVSRVILNKARPPSGPG